MGGETAAECHEGRPYPYLGSRCTQTSHEVNRSGGRDCVGMLLRTQSCVGCLQLHNVRELLEKLGIGEEGVSLGETVELNLLNQSKICPSIILLQNDLSLELAINLGITMDKRGTASI